MMDIKRIQTNAGIDHLEGVETLNINDYTLLQLSSKTIFCCDSSPISPNKCQMSVR